MSTTETPEPPPPMAPDDAVEPPAAHADAVDAATPIDQPRTTGRSSCPFLVTDGGGWRAPTPSSEHRCGAFAPSAALARQKQARLCLTPAHATCATYTASVEARTARAGTSGTSESVGRWALARTTVTLEPVSGPGVTLGGVLGSRRTRQVAPALVLMLALGVLALSRWGDQGGVAGIPTPRPSAASSSPASTAGSSTEASPVATEEPTPAASSNPQPSATPAPTPAGSYQLYTVKSGDTLYDLAIKFKTTVATLKKINGLTSTTLHAGQVLKVP